MYTRLFLLHGDHQALPGDSTQKVASWSDSLMSFDRMDAASNDPGFTCESSVFNIHVRKEVAERVYVWEGISLCCRRSATAA